MYSRSTQQTITLMKRKVLVPVLLAVGATAAGILYVPALAGAAESTQKPLVFLNGSAENAMTIVQNATVGKSRSSSGALLIDNTRNNHTGLTVYTNAGAQAVQPLMRLEVDNPAWTEEVLYIRSDSPTSRGLIRLDSPAPEIEFVETDQKGAAGKFEVRVQHDTFQINSRLADDSGFENKITMTHAGDLVLEKGALKVEGTAASEFSGGINVTGGCIAVDGTCVSLGSAAEKASVPTPTAQAAGVTITNGVPPALACNSHQERGALALDTSSNRLYVCNGPERGWDYTSLSD